MISSPDGDVSPLSAEGFFFRDTRFLSRWSLRINGQPPEALARAVPDPYSATFVARIPPRPGRADSNLMVRAAPLRRPGHAGGPGHPQLRRGAGLLRASSWPTAPTSPTCSRSRRPGSTASGERGRDRTTAGPGLQPPATAPTAAASASPSRSRPCSTATSPAGRSSSRPRGTWSLCQQFTCGIDDDEIEPRWLCGQPVERAKPAERMAAWRRSVPVLDTDHEGLRAVVARSAEDLGALRIFDPDYPGADRGGGRRARGS